MAAGKKTGGRQKGTPNKITVELRDMILGALNDAGGQAYLVEQAQKTPSAFLSLVAKVLPMRVEGHDGAPLVPVINLTIAALPETSQ